MKNPSNSIRLTSTIHWKTQAQGKGPGACVRCPAGSEQRGLVSQRKGFSGTNISYESSLTDHKQKEKDKDKPRRVCANETSYGADWVLLKSGSRFSPATRLICTREPRDEFHYW